MAPEVGVRSEQGSFGMLKDAFGELMASTSLEEKANLLVIINELYADGSCRCEEKEASYGDSSEEAAVCNRHLVESREQMLQLYREFLAKVEG